MTTIRIELPAHLQTLARIRGEVRLELEAEPTLANTLDALEALYPQLCGTIRDHVTRERRPFLRFFANNEDISHQSPETLLPTPITTAAEPLLIIGAIAGG